MITGMIIGFVIKMIFIYFIAMHGLYLLLIWIGATELKRYHQRIAFGEFQRISRSPLSMPVSVVIPAYNEEKMILNTVMNMLRLRYPQHEVIIVNDGSKDRTLQVLIEHFNLRRIDKVYKKHFETQPIRGFYQSLEYPNLLVIDKENGRRADAVNAGLNLVRYPLICQTDADCVLEEDALLRMARPFLLNSNVIAATAFIRPSNGIVVDQGRILERGLPKGWLPLFQVVEYLRSFQWARSGLTRLKSMLCMPGGYTVVRKDIYLKVGGANAKAVVDDFELTVTLHRYVHEHKQEGPLELAYVPDPGCYTEVPERLRGYASQRNFWQRAILQSLIWNRDMALNPRYGLAGMFGFPFYFLFEGISALVEGLAYTMAPIVYFTGKASLTEMVLLFIFGVVLGAFVSVCAVLMQERTRMRQAKTRNLIRLLTAGFLEHFGYHQFHVLCRIIGIYDLLIRHRIVYGFRERHGYQSPV